jgi:hypothetical protein
MGERHIWETIAKHPEKIGFPGALALPLVQLGRAGGYIDLVLLPTPTGSGPKLVLVEAKLVQNSDSSDKVIGQLLKYYARALRIGTEGLEGLRECARQEANGQLREGPLLSMGKTFRTNQTAAGTLLQRGERLMPRDLALVVALDEFHHRQSRRLGFIVNMLRKHHNLPIDIFEVHGNIVKPCPCSDESLADAV